MGCQGVLKVWSVMAGCGCDWSWWRRQVWVFAGAVEGLVGLVCAPHIPLCSAGLPFAPGGVFSSPSSLPRAVLSQLLLRLFAVSFSSFCRFPQSSFSVFPQRR